MKISVVQERKKFLAGPIWGPTDSFQINEMPLGLEGAMNYKVILIYRGDTIDNNRNKVFKFFTMARAPLIQVETPDIAIEMKKILISRT